jgi:hypothetical protein
MGDTPPSQTDRPGAVAAGDCDIVYCLFVCQFTLNILQNLRRPSPFQTLKISFKDVFISILNSFSGSPNQPQINQQINDTITEMQINIAKGRPENASTLRTFPTAPFVGNVSGSYTPNGERSTNRLLHLQCAGHESHPVHK